MEVSGNRYFFFHTDTKPGMHHHHRCCCFFFACQCRWWQMFKFFFQFSISKKRDLNLVIKTACSLSSVWPTINPKRDADYVLMQDVFFTIFNQYISGVMDMTPLVSFHFIFTTLDFNFKIFSFFYFIQTHTYTHTSREFSIIDLMFIIII